MIKALPYLSKNLRAVTRESVNLSNIYKVMLDNYNGKDYKELDSIKSSKKNKTLVVSDSLKCQLLYCILDNSDNLYFYNNCIIKSLDNNILKFAVGDQSPSIIKTNETYIIEKPTIIHNKLGGYRSRYLVLKY